MSAALNAFDSDSDSENDDFITSVSLNAVLDELIQNEHRYTRVALHNSAFTGSRKLNEWMDRHPQAMQAQLGTTPACFNFLLQELCEHSTLADSRYVEAAEQLAIFLYIIREGLGVRHCAQAFNRSLDTTSVCFHRVLAALIEPEFYKRWVSLPTVSTPTSAVIKDDGRFSGWLDNCIGAIDGTHIPAHVPLDQAQVYRNRKGWLSQNVLAACDFDFKFTYILAGWEGSANDGRVFQEAIENDLIIPPGRFFLADAGFGASRTMLVPYRGTRYHLAEWVKSNQRPKNAKELFNLRHSSARNVIERIFGTVKRKWKILARGCEYDLETQARLVYAVCCLHNITRTFSHPLPDKIPSQREFERQYRDGLLEEDEDDGGFVTEDENHQNPPLSAAAEKEQGELWREDIALEVWRAYNVELDRRAAFRLRRERSQR